MQIIADGTVSLICPMLCLPWDKTHSHQLGLVQPGPIYQKLSLEHISIRWSFGCINGRTSGVTCSSLRMSHFGLQWYFKLLMHFLNSFWAVSQNDKKGSVANFSSWGSRMNFNHVCWHRTFFSLAPVQITYLSLSGSASGSRNALIIHYQILF